MGLLDDAIREHLDLKRRRGADPTEIQRAEQEALGPVRRNRSGDADEVGGDEPAYATTGSATDEPDEGIAADLVDESDEDLGFGDERVAYDDQRVGYNDDPPTAEEQIVHRSADPAEPGFDADDPFADDPEPEPEGGSTRDDRPGEDEHATRMMRASGVPAPSDRTAEFDVEEVFAEEDETPDRPDRGDDEDDDVLEETPEFLQDTPDHDRLWFEQRPPRDFDFDN